MEEEAALHCIDELCRAEGEEQECGCEGEAECDDQGEGEDGVEGEPADYEGSNEPKRKPRKPRAGDDGGDARKEPRKPARTPQKRKPRSAKGEDGRGEIDSSVLPPAIGRPERSAESDAEGEAPAAKPRRTRRTLATRSTDVEAAE